MDSQKLCDKLIHNVRFHKLLVLFDHDLARAAREQGCPCGGRLHSAHYPRKPRGVPEHVRELYYERLSLCCDRDSCRARTTPPSLRFLGRKVYVAATLLLISIMVHGGTSEQLSELSRAYGVNRRTVARWREWWRSTFTQTRLWQAKRSAFAPPVDEGRLPASMFERFLGSSVRQLVSLLRLLTPITGGTAAVRVS